MAKEVIMIPDAPEYPFSPAVRAGDYVFVSGQGGFEDPSTGESISGIEAQTRKCLENMRRVLEAADSSLDEIVKVTVFLRNAADYTTMNDVYKSFFQKEIPARSTAITDLAIPSMLVEMDCIAYCPKS